MKYQRGRWYFQSRGPYRGENSGQSRDGNKVRASKQTYNNGDQMYYECEGREKLIVSRSRAGLFQDGKFVFVHHGSFFHQAGYRKFIDQMKKNKQIYWSCTEENNSVRIICPKKKKREREQENVLHTEWQQTSCT